MTTPKPPRSVWVRDDSWLVSQFVSLSKPADGWTRYDLHRPAKRKGKKARK
jgi:hypothetical protein